MPDFGEVREKPCTRCGGKVVYQCGNWHCGGYEHSPRRPEHGCGWSTRQNVPAGMVTLEHCPSCGNRIVYNGNYFCEFFGGACDWALPHPARKRVDRELALRLTGETR